ncbi:MAG: hypothetical protein QXD48_01230 [Candidatus Aenigmatarchaeota archaeon]
MEMQDEIKKRRKEEWFEVWFSIEALGTTKEIVEESLKTHIEKMKNVKGAFVYDTKFYDIQKVENPIKNVKEGYSQVVEIKFFVKNLITLLNMVMVYGPSAIEILGPKKKNIEISEIQNIANMLAGIVHQFAAAGVGGIIITPK